LTEVHIIGGGPAGSTAAIAAAQQGALVRLFEKSAFPRHKVCGEFLSPEIAPLLDGLGVWARFAQAHPASLKQINLYLGSRRKNWKLAEPAFGLSRYALDELLIRHAAACGATVVRDTGGAPSASGPPTVLAHGRKTSAPKGSRLFGFKAHFSGPVDDSVDLFFFSGCYAGVSAVENGITNVCALAPESFLQHHHFHMDAVLEQSLPLRERLAPLTRKMDWLITGPLVFRDNFHGPPSENIYCAGDALGFVDPFTGSGILAALLTGRIAGFAAARHLPAADYVRQCRSSLGIQYHTTSILRALVQNGIAEKLARFVPGRWLFELTRPRRRAFGR